MFNGPGGGGCPSCREDIKHDSICVALWNKILSLRPSSWEELRARQQASLSPGCRGSSRRGGTGAHSSPPPPGALCRVGPIPPAANGPARAREGARWLYVCLLPRCRGRQSGGRDRVPARCLQYAKRVSARAAGLGSRARAPARASFLPSGQRRPEPRRPIGAADSGQPIGTRVAGANERGCDSPAVGRGEHGCLRGGGCARRRASAMDPPRDGPAGRAVIVGR